MTGKEQFKEVRNGYIDDIMDVYGVSRDIAYQALTVALDNPCVRNAISKSVADQFYSEEVHTNPFEEWANQFLTKANKRWV
jgi:hypothetical protein